jgi:hypothetical protein
MRIWSILIPSYTPKDSIEIGFIFFQLVLYFLRNFEIYMNFWNYKRKWKWKTVQAGLGPRPRGHHLTQPWNWSGRPKPVRHARRARPRGPSDTAGPGSPTDKVGRGKRREHQCGEGVASGIVVGNQTHWRRSSTVRLLGGREMATLQRQGAPTMVCSGSRCSYSSARARGMWGAAPIEEAPNDGSSHRGGGRKCGGSGDSTNSGAGARAPVPGLDQR